MLPQGKFRAELIAGRRLFQQSRRLGFICASRGAEIFGLGRCCTNLRPQHVIKKCLRGCSALTGVLEAGFAEYLKGFTDGPAPTELLDREGVPRRQPFLKRSLPAEVSLLLPPPLFLINDPVPLQSFLKKQELI